MNRKPLILCADDSTNILDGWKTVLELQGYEVLTAADGSEALQEFVSHPVDLVLLDYHMPQMNGDVAAAHMKACKIDVPIALMSADDLTPLSELKAVDALVSKSESVITILRIVDHLLSLRFLFEPLEGLGIHEDAA
jgi:CheY-like chemotaxis protein